MQQSTNIGELLLQHHIRPSYQRVRILQYLSERRSHPTIDEIYSALVAEIPTLSRTTVYNTLNLFIREKIVQSLSIEVNQLRYDADTSAHGHFKCVRCGKIHDFAVESVIASGLERFETSTRNVFYTGVCPECRMK